MPIIAYECLHVMQHGASIASDAYPACFQMCRVSSHSAQDSQQLQDAVNMLLNTYFFNTGASEASGGHPKQIKVEQLPMRFHAEAWMIPRCCQHAHNYIRVSTCHATWSQHRLRCISSMPPDVQGFFAHCPALATAARCCQNAPKHACLQHRSDRSERRAPEADQSRPITNVFACRSIDDPKLLPTCP